MFLGCKSAIRNDFILQGYELYALSELKYKNNETFFMHLLIISGDVELNSSPDFQCSICNKTIRITYGNLCCYNWDSGVCQDNVN